MAAPHVAGAIALYLASNPQLADISAFLNARAALLAGAEDTGEGTTFTVRQNNNPHDEDFLDASGL